jgi:lysophospholipase L1-like esterase
LTSADFLGDWATRGPDGDSPLANAVRTLRGGGYSVVTLDIGGNDILRLVKPGQPCAGKQIESDACFAAMRQALREMTTPNLAPIVAALVEAAPAGTQIIVLTYPNPFSVGRSTTAEERTDAAMAELNVLITNAVRANQAKAADRDVTLALVDLAPLFNKQGARLTHIADATPDIHPNDAGHGTIAEAIKKVYRP